MSEDTAQELRDFADWEDKRDPLINTDLLRKAADLIEDLQSFERGANSLMLAQYDKIKELESIIRAYAQENHDSLESPEGYEYCDRCNGFGVVKL